MKWRSSLVALLCAAGLVTTATAQTDDDQTELYEADLETGELSLVGAIEADETVIGFALLPPEDDGTGDALAEDAPAGAAIALTDDDEIFEFDVTDPGLPGEVTEVTGLDDDEELVGIDVRPATGELWAVSDQSKLYNIDLDTGEAVSIGGTFDPELEDENLGFDFNPTVDRIRVDVATGQNLRLNPETGLIGSNPDTGAPTIDGTLAYAEGDDNAGTDPMVVGAAYTNSVADAEETELYVIDMATQSLAIQDPPNDGVLNTVGPLGTDVTERSAFDIAPGGEAFVTIPADDDDTGAATPVADDPDTVGGTPDALPGDSGDDDADDVPDTTATVEDDGGDDAETPESTATVEDDGTDDSDDDAAETPDDDGDDDDRVQEPGDDDGTPDDEE